MVTFQLMNRKYKMSLNEWSDHFGFFNRDSSVRSMNRCLKPYPQTYFSKLSIYANTPKGIYIGIPDVRYLYYIISNTLHTCGEFRKVKEDDLIILTKDDIPNFNVTPNLGSVLIFHWEHQAHQTREDIT
jgi:hypothetical protein